MAKIFSVINNKGGTGKTTTVLNLGAGLAKLGNKVLLIDLDSQCNLTSSLGIFNAEPHSGNLILKHNDILEVMHETGELTLIPSTDKLLDFELHINSEPGRDYLIKEALKKVENNFDFILIDCPPSLGALAINSLVAANYYIVPMQTENFAYIGLDSILHIAEKVKTRMNPNLELAGILLVRFTQRTKFGQAIVSSIGESSRLKEKLFQTYIRQDISLMESTAFHKSVFDYEPKSRGAEDYLDLAKEIVEKYGKNQ